MREAVGNTFVFGFIIVFVILFVALFATSSAYSKASKVKNEILDIVEENADLLDDASSLPDSVVTEIDTELRAVGYRLNHNQQNGCSTEYMDGASGGVLMNRFSNYRYCVYKHQRSESQKGNLPHRGNYYTVVTYMYFDIPLIGQNLEFPIKGQTRTYFKEVKYNG